MNYDYNLGFTHLFHPQMTLKLEKMEKSIESIVYTQSRYADLAEMERHHESVPGTTMLMLGTFAKDEKSPALDYVKIFSKVLAAKQTWGTVTFWQERSDKARHPRHDIACRKG